MASRVTITDKGYKALMVRLDKAKRRSGVEVGVHGSGGYPNGLSVEEVATINELGLGPPARPFVGGYVEANRDEIERRIREAGEAIVQGTEPQAALDRLGMITAAGMKANIVAGIDPPNAESTIAKKGSSKPLVDKGQLINSITHKVV